MAGRANHTPVLNHLLVNVLLKHCVEKDSEALSRLSEKTCHHLLVMFIVGKGLGVVVPQSLLHSHCPQLKISNPF